MKKNIVSKILNSIFGLVFVKRDVDRLNNEFDDFKKETRQGFLRVQWDIIYAKSFDFMSDSLYQRACEIYDRYIECGGNWYVHNEMEELTIRYNKWKKCQKRKIK